MACCPCFKSQVRDDRDEQARRKGGNRNSIRKDKNENDLLNLNAMGMDGAKGADEWSDPKGGNSAIDNETGLRNSQQTDMHGNSQFVDTKVIITSYTH